MDKSPLNEGLIIRYLLGELEENEQIEVEDRAFQDQQCLQSILAIEADLIDEYVRGDLPDSRRQHFETRFLASAERRQKIEFARALARVGPDFLAVKDARSALAQEPIPFRQALAALIGRLTPAARFAFAAAALILFVGALWLVTESVRLRAQLARLSDEQRSREREEQTLQRQHADELASSDEQLKRMREQLDQAQQMVSELQHQAEQNPSPVERPGIVSMVLLPGISRGGSAHPKLKLPESARRVRLQIGIDPADDYPQYRVDLRGPSGNSVWTQDSLSPVRGRSGRTLVLNLPAAILKAGQHELALKGISSSGKTDDVAYHYFDVIK
ncbi:MAG TPA: hypothetical protein VKM94_18230 [Blastocatellia bacterium]|nr:hypothetical protein [Blastocatellia bacterium]